MKKSYVKFNVDPNDVKRIRKINIETKIYVSHLYRQAFKLGIAELEKIYKPKTRND